MPATVADQKFQDLIFAVHARLRASPSSQTEMLRHEMQARLDYEAALSAWLGGNVKAG